MADVAIIGGGKMGEALLAGIVAAGTPSDRIVIVEKDTARVDALQSEYGVRPVGMDEAAEAGTILIAVKPQDIEPLLTGLAPKLTPQHLIVSIAAGVTVARLEAAAPGTPVVRAMPNTPALVGQGITAITGGALTGESELALAEALLGAVGPVVRVAETQLDAVTALSGSGPAYFFLFVEALIDAGVLLGLARPLATQLAVQTALGSATMLVERGEHPVALKEAVTSPGGTTIAGLAELEAHGLRATVTAAVRAAACRSQELGSS